MDIEHYSRLSKQYYDGELPSLLKKYIKKGDSSILDCGCGDGAIVYALNKEGYLEKNKIYAIDLSRERINLVKKISDGIIARVDNAETLEKIDNSSIDFLISTQVIEHVNDAKMAESINRVSKKNALVYISTIFKKWYAWYFYRNNGKWVLDPTHLREYTNDDQLLRLFDKDGFQLLESLKRLVWWPAIDFFLEKSPLENRRVYDNHLIKLIRKAKIPILGYYFWEIVLKKL